MHAGPEFVLPHLIAGDLLDYQAHDGRSVDRGWFCAPVITLFAFGGLGLVILRQLMSVCPSCCEGTCFGVTDVPSKARAERDLWVGACFVVWTMLFCGRGMCSRLAFCLFAWRCSGCLYKAYFEC